jgi:hypothetical protein
MIEILYLVKSTSKENKQSTCEFSNIQDYNLSIIHTS